jgi:hypothetical protein
MKALTSYLRHWIVAGILLWASKYGMSGTGADEMAQGVAMIILGTGTWALVKYAPALAKQFGIFPLLLMAFLLPCCTPGQLALARAVPVKACVLTKYGEVCYSSQTGISTQVDLRSGK